MNLFLAHVQVVTKRRYAEHLILDHVSFLQQLPGKLQLVFQAILEGTCYVCPSPAVILEYQLSHVSNGRAGADQILRGETVTAPEASWQSPSLVGWSGSLLAFPVGSLLFDFLLKYLYCFIFSKCSFLFSHGMLFVKLFVSHPSSMLLW